MEIVKNKRIHWEKCRGTVTDNIKYCTKEGDYVLNKIVLPKAIKVCTPYGWQLEVLDIIKNEPDNRKIFWYWSVEGGVGKSELCKYLCVNHGAIICSGDAKDIKYMVVKYHEKHETYPEIVVLDIPKYKGNGVSYVGIEEIKNGCFASSKYECDMVVMNAPHIFCFANEGPQMNAMSKDRWVVKEIKSG